jgi:hypothetical protein
MGKAVMAAHRWRLSLTSETSTAAKSGGSTTTASGKTAAAVASAAAGASPLQVQQQMMDQNYTSTVTWQKRMVMPAQAPAHQRQQQRRETAAQTAARSEGAVAPSSAANALVPMEEKMAPYGFAFTPGGLLFPYSLGMAQQLKQSGMLHDAVPLVGASAGSLTVASFGAGGSLRSTSDCSLALSSC